MYRLVVAALLRRRRNNGDYLPLFHSLRVVDRRRPFSRKWVHIIPVIVIVAFFILWFFSRQVDMEVKDGRITEVPNVEESFSLNETLVEHALLAVASPPYASISHMQTMGSQTAAEPATRTE